MTTSTPPTIAGFTIRALSKRSWVISCNACGRRWSLPRQPANLSVGVRLALLNHQRSHTGRAERRAC